MQRHEKHIVGLPESGLLACPATQPSGSNHEEALIFILSRLKKAERV